MNISYLFFNYTPLNSAELRPCTWLFKHKIKKARHNDEQQYKYISRHLGNATLDKSIFFFIYPPTHPPTHPSTHPPTHLPTHPPIYPPTHPSTHPPTHPPIHPPTFPSIQPSIYQPSTLKPRNLCLNHSNSTYLRTRYELIFLPTYLQINISKRMKISC